jgi:tetratricopeptide (TPR) repeat protein
LERALAISEAALGPDHPIVGTWCSNLGLVLRDLGDLPGAREQLERALAIGEAALGPDHPDVGTWRNNLGGMLQALGDLPGAREQFERALAIGEAALGPDHPTVRTLRRSLDSVATHQRGAEPRKLSTSEDSQIKAHGTDWECAPGRAAADSLWSGNRVTGRHRRSHVTVRRDRR